MRRFAYEVELDNIAAAERERYEAALPVLELLAEVVRAEAGPWRARAACVGQGEVMFSTTREGLAEALEICGRCEVVAECRRWSDSTEAGARIFGVAGGETADERRARRRGAHRAA